MDALLISNAIKSLPDYSYLKKRFRKGYLRQIDRYITVQRGRKTLIANSFFINHVLIADNNRALKLIDIFREPLYFTVFLVRIATAFRINLSKPGVRNLNILRDIFDIARQFIRYRFVVQANFNEYEQLKLLRESLRPHPKYPEVVYVIPSLDCNFRCPGCFIYRGDWKIKKQTMMSTNVFDYEHEVVMRTLPHNKKSPLLYRFYGGEPLLNKPLIEYASNKIRSLEKKGRYGIIRPVISITTNASLIDEDFIRMCKKYRIVLIISLDGTGTSHDSRRKWPNGRGTFKDVLRKIRLVEKLSYDYKLSWTIWSENIDRTLQDISWVAKYLKTRDVCFNFAHTFRTPPYKDIGEPEFFKKMHRIYDALLKHGIQEGRLSGYRMVNKLKKNRLPYPYYCTAVGGGQFVLRPDGKIGLCQAGSMFEEKQWQRPEEIGIPSENPERLRWLARTPSLMKKCYLACPYFSRCPGGCPYWAEKCGERICDPCATYCMIEKFLVERALIEDYL